MPSLRKKTKTELAEVRKDDKQDKKKNPFKKDDPDNDEGDKIKLSSLEAEQEKPLSSSVRRQIRENERLIDKEFADATPAERADLKRDLRKLDPMLAREMIDTRRKINRLYDSFPSRQSELMSRYNDQPAENNSLQLAGNEERRTAERSSSSRERERAVGFGGADPWGNKFSADRSPASPSRGGANPFPTQQQDGRATEYDKPHSQLLFGHSTDTTSDENGPPQPPIRGGQPLKSNDNKQLPSRYSNSQSSLQGPPGTQTARNLQQIEYERNGSSNRLQNEPSNNIPEISDPTQAERQQQLERLIAITETELAQQKTRGEIGLADPEQQRVYVEKQVYLRMLYLMAGQQVRSFDAIPGIPAADQEFWRQLFWGMANYFDSSAMPDSRVRATQTVRQLDLAMQRLSEKANLELQNLNFCHKIASFGNYERFKQSEFRPGQRVLLYAEVKNFKSNPTDDGKFYRTVLKSTITVHRVGSDGGHIAEFQFDPAEDLCRNYRKDYFHSYEVAIPKDITLGPHVMTLTITDQLGDKIATDSLKFNVK